jgi:hypothetical protein
MIKTMRLSQLKKLYETVINEYIQKFCNKQELELEHWVGNDIGSIACFGDMFFFSFRDIVYDINSKQPKGLIIKWIYESIDNEEFTINYFSYSKGLRFTDLKK